ncbi:MAG TPA: arylesterase [Gemmatimonadaceae bacterium]|nr:arylesterase [Gemmatimonadaceae bacterium]
MRHADPSLALGMTGRSVAGTRKVVSLLYGALLAVVACAGEASDARSASAPADSAQSAPRRPRQTILVVGTSLTAGLGLEPEQAYPAILQEKLDSAGLDYEVVNAGVSGETSSALLRRIDWLLQQPFEWILIETGANDGLRGIPVATMRANIQQIIDGVRATRPGARIALVRMEAPPNLGASYTRQFRQAYEELAKANDVVLLPFLLDGIAGIRTLNQADGIHPNETGARMAADNVWKGLRPLLD